jgi:hypothetical protein
MAEEKNISGAIEQRYPLAIMLEKRVFECKPSLEDTRICKIVVKAYKLCASLQSARDLVEEYVACSIWPLCRSRRPCKFFNRSVNYKQYKFLDFEVKVPRSLNLMRKF